MGLGFTEAPITELGEISSTSSSAAERTKALLYLALWHMRAGREGYLAAMKYLSDASATKKFDTLKSEITTAKLICLFHLGDVAEARKLQSNIEKTNGLAQDVLALANFQQTPEARVGLINRVLAHCKIPGTLVATR